MKTRLANASCLALAVLGLQQPSYGATCSCAGIPLLSAIDTSASEQGDFFINFSTEDHQISDLVNGTNKISDRTRRDRRSVSQVFSASYAITDRWSVSGLVSHVEHSRKIGSSLLGTTTTSGMSDSVLLVRYTPLFITPFSRNEFSIGVGARIATGKDDARINGITVSEDMQPSIGADGKILWASYSYAFNQAATIQLNTSANYIDNDANDRRYSFGDELNVAIGLGHSITPKFSYSAALRYRRADADQRFDFNIPNTGGEWLDFVPAVQFAATDNFSIGVSGRIPVARNLNGALQFTTSYSYGVSLTYGF